MDEQFSAFSPNKQNTSGKKKRAFLYVAVFILIIAGAIFLGNQLLSSSNDADLTPSPTMEPTPTEEPTPTQEATESAKKTTPTPTTKVAKTTPTPATTAATTPVAGSLTIKVLNGSGEKGAAGTAASLLKDKGYVISSTGNADNFDYTDTIIQIKKSKQAGLSKLKTALSTDYTVSSTTETLAETEDVDAIVIVGAN